MMLSPDLLDRRALALVAMVDGYGRPIAGPVSLESEGVSGIAKREGQIAILNAAGFAEYTSAFTSPPAAPAVQSVSLVLDLTPTDPDVLPRRLTLKLPRNPDPTKKDEPQSLFQPVLVALSPSPRVPVIANACILRASVRRAGDGAFVENALVRARSADDAFTAWALTDPAGEAALVFPALPISFAGPGGSVKSSIGCSVVVHADPASARFSDNSTLAAARRSAAGRRVGHADPDAIANANAPDFAAGANVDVAAGSQPAVALQWTAP